ncbi:MAG: hypothetical protein OEZ57_12165 [Nitrospirota bacterium]|nr:hypothetical protein [Nitrospirota bacterium]MDH5775658.1 hypothetical protein [Nitrospirota bacterium]
MDEAMGTGDIIIGAFAALGVLVLIVVFLVVVKTKLLKKDEEPDEQS